MTTDVAQKPKDFPALLRQFLPEIQRALPSHLNGDRMSRIALTAFRRNPQLAQCEPRSVFAAVIQSSQLGLEIDTLGRAYLVPYKKSSKVNGQWVTTWECQFIPGWKGLVELVNRAGQATVWTGAVFEGDVFDYELGDRPCCYHKPGDNHGEGEPIYVYACGKVKGSDVATIEVWSMAKVRRHLDKYNKVGEKHYAFENMEMYGRKVALLQVLKYMPMSPEVARAIELDHAATNGNQGLNLKDAIAGEWSPVPEEQEVQEVQGNGLPKCTPESFAKQKTSWQAVIISKKKSVNDLIATIETKETLTPEQKMEIAGWATLEG